MLESVVFVVVLLFCLKFLNMSLYVKYVIASHFSFLEIQSGARNVIPLIVHVTHSYYYKSI